MLIRAPMLFPAQHAITIIRTLQLNSFIFYSFSDGFAKSGPVTCIGLGFNSSDELEVVRRESRPTASSPSDDL